ncbi:MAG: hypothetical protein AB7U05_12345 [Mangrovibacterium sp.]
MIRIFVLSISMLFCSLVNGQVKYPNLRTSSQIDLRPNQLSNQHLPVIGVWVWGQRDLEPDGYKQAIDHLSTNSPFNLIVPFLRFHDKELLDDEVYTRVKLAAEYAVENNIGLLPDLDVRSARRAFQKQYPDEMQQMLRIREVALSETGSSIVALRSIKDLNDHYSGGNIPKYNSIESSLLRVYGYQKTPEGINPKSIKEITSKCELLYSSDDSLTVQLPVGEPDKYTHASVMASFTLFYPDVFAPHLLKFQRDILKRYADLSIPGVCKDEWGFPPYYPRYYAEGASDFWYSEHRAKEYAKITGGRDLLADCLLMAFETQGMERDRQVVINHFRQMSFHRNTEIENDFYDAVKEYFGPDAAVTVHPTWWPYPDLNEFKKNGLNWWAAKRDWAQTDELVPFGVRTALCKKWDSPVWYNMYYTARLSDQVWGSALAGGRINYLRYYSLFKPDIMRAENRIRLLNYISESPLDCPVAVVFGHTSAMNWASEGFNDVGMKLINKFWNNGFPADLIPTSEIENGSLIVDDQGWIRYGSQKYAAVVLYNPEFEGKATSDLFKKASGGKTTILRMGEWNYDFDGNPVNVMEYLPKDMVMVSSIQLAFENVLSEMKRRKIEVQTPATAVLDTSFYTLRGYEHESYFPANTGQSRLIDGTHLFIGGTKQVSGDPITGDFKVNGFDVSVDAVGVVGIRLNKQGMLEALAASELSYIKAGDFSLSLNEPMDIALWRNADGEWYGVIQSDSVTQVPGELLELTRNWDFLGLPVPPQLEATQ